ncbi:unnamed protein product [Trifolium pratense]|uniref:Uncharacterized protein n=1 Tax=Trifolium pratense TaxID=57577 RepID=A0ACB0MC72_TRIPR|nr:unnamed protein product [Trifolium pratense]
MVEGKESKTVPPSPQVLTLTFQSLCNSNNLTVLHFIVVIQLFDGLEAYLMCRTVITHIVFQLKKADIAYIRHLSARLPEPADIYYLQESSFR